MANTHTAAAECWCGGRAPHHAATDKDTIRRALAEAEEAARLLDRLTLGEDAEPGLAQLLHEARLASDRFAEELYQRS